MPCWANSWPREDAPKLKAGTSKPVFPSTRYGSKRSGVGFIRDIVTAAFRSGIGWRAIFIRSDGFIVGICKSFLVRLPPYQGGTKGGSSRSGAMGPRSAAGTEQTRGLLGAVPPNWWIFAMLLVGGVFELVQLAARKWPGYFPHGAALQDYMQMAAMGLIVVFWSLGFGVVWWRPAA